MIAAVTAICMLAGCGKSAAEEELPFDPADEQFIDEEEFVDEYEEVEEYPEEYEEEKVVEEKAADDKGSAQDTAAAAGTWYTEGYDEEANWAMSYKIELTNDGKATCTGWRNKDTGTYEISGSNKALITFDHCETDEAGEGFKVVDGFKYTIEMTINGDDAQIKIDAPDVISNLEDGTVHRKSDSSKGDEGEGADIADGEYITDEVYKGDISKDGATVTVETALSHYDKDWNVIPDYEKRTYVFSTSKDCKCVIYQEKTEEYPVAEQVEFINDFLHGNSGLPITLIIKNNELVEIGFSS